MIVRRTFLLGGVALGAAGCGAASAADAAFEPPLTPRGPVVDRYFGIPVADPYRWLETGDATQKLWFEAQNRYARAVLDRIPGRDVLKARVEHFSASGESVSRVRVAGGRIFYLKRKPGEEYFKLFVRPSAGGAERLLVDPAEVGAGNAPHAIDYYAVSHDGSSLAFGTSAGGSENSVLRVMDVTTGKRGAEAIDRAGQANPSWRPDGRSFFYTRLDPSGGADNAYSNARVYIHRVGSDPATDVAVAGTGVGGSFALKADDFPSVVCVPGSPYVLGVAEYG